MSIIRRSSVFDPFSLDLFEGLGFPTTLSLSRSGETFAFASTRIDLSLSRSGETFAFASTRIDWKETPEAHLFKVDLPGVKKEEVKVEVEDGRILKISGERKREQEEKTDTWHRVECSSGQFLRRFQLPENAKVDQVKATMENSVLTVTVPKDYKPEVKSINISG